MIVFLGTDGCGKSSVIEQLSQYFDNTWRFHLRPGVVPRLKSGQGMVATPHALPAHRYFISLIKIIFLSLDYIIGYSMKIKPLFNQSAYVFFDRYFHDILVDPKRYRYGGPLWALRFAIKIIPKPDLFILLDAPVDVLRSRAQEVSYAETNNQREAYLELFGNLPSGIVVDAAMPIAEVVDRVRDIIFRHDENRNRP